MVTLAPQLMHLLDFVPHFHITIIGPWKISPHPHAERVRMEADYVLAGSLEDAVEEIIEEHVKPFCAERDHPFNPAEWAVLEVRRCNCN